VLVSAVRIVSLAVPTFAGMFSFMAVRPAFLMWTVMLGYNGHWNGPLQAATDEMRTGTKLSTNWSMEVTEACYGALC
jgi:hypothetical protein